MEESKLERQFDQAMLEIYRRAKAEAKYPANTFFHMLNERGGLRTAKTLINSSRPSDGYTELHLRGRLDLTVEAQVLDNPRWHRLFSPEELNRTRRRLREYGYQSSVSLPTSFEFGSSYSREQVASRIGMPTERQGGAWMTDYDKWNGEFFVFCNVGVAGRSGHDYANRWNGKVLEWFAKTGTHLGQKIISELIDGSHPIHVFWRGKDRAAFTYAGRAEPLEVFDETPVRIVWSFERDGVSSDAKRGEDLLRRGPIPTAGQRNADYQDGLTSLYLMSLHGDSRTLLPSIDRSKRLIKVGISNNAARRATELNNGFPPKSVVGWRIEHQRYLDSGADAFAIESECLERLREGGHWIGGEFAVIDDASLAALISEFWSPNERAGSVASD